MEKTLVITEREDGILTTEIEDGTVSRFQVEPVEEENILGNIYVGKVRNIVKNINAAFVEFLPGMMGYLSLQEGVVPRHTQGKVQDQTRVLIGDEIIVQVSREAVKTKPPTLTGKIDFAGKYTVLSYGGTGIGVSRRIKDREERERLRELLQDFSSEEYGIMARTNSAEVSSEEILAELRRLLERSGDVFASGMHRAPFACLYQAPAGFLASILSVCDEELLEVITDSEKLYQRITRYLQENGWQGKIPVRLWREEEGKVLCVYNIDRELKHALSRRVWLRSGAYLVIEPTEALAVIDVNTGKAISKKKDVQKTYLKINREAACEIAHQIRLRNLSGIIVVDFIDMEEEEARRELLALFSRELAKDRIPTKLVDMTKLGLVEITRKKVRKPLYEQIHM